MKDYIRQQLNENLTKADVKKEIKAYIDSAEFERKVTKIVKDKVKNDKDLEKHAVEISKNVLTQLYKTLWTKRGFWRSALANRAS